MISVVVPVYNEEENIESLVREINMLRENIPLTEIIYVNDGSTDGTELKLVSLKEEFPILRLVTHETRSGQSCATKNGVALAVNDCIVTLDGDGQNDPRDIERLYEFYKKQKILHKSVMVVGIRKKREDSFSRRLASRIANSLRSFLLKDGIKDTGCSLKIFSKNDYMNLPYFDHMHRYLPALMLRHGVSVCHQNVSHRPRHHGESKYNNLNRALEGIIDLFGVWWLKRRSYNFPKVREI